MIELKNIKVEFDIEGKKIKACDDVSLTIDDGDIFGVVGYSGAGKSTLIRCINLLQRPDKGEVLIDGENIVDFPNKVLREKRKKIGMIFQHFNLLNARNVFENVYYPIRKWKIPESEKETKVRKLLELVDIREKEKAYPSELSGGQKQRVAIARALATDPEILLCDEATSALDPKTTKSILDLLKKLNKELNLTIVLITHEMQVVKEICNKCAVMENGKILESGSVVDIFSNPKEELTSEFIETASHKKETIARMKKTLPNEDIYYLQYRGESTRESVIVNLYKLFKVETNILAGNIEYISDVPLGNLVVTFTGEDEALKKALKYLEDNDVSVEVC